MSAVILLLFNLSVEVMRVYDVQYYTVKEVKMKKIEATKNYIIVKATGHK